MPRDGSSEKGAQAPQLLPWKEKLPAHSPSPAQNHRHPQPGAQSTAWRRRGGLQLPARRPALWIRLAAEQPLAVALPRSQVRTGLRKEGLPAAGAPFPGAGWPRGLSPKATATTQAETPRDSWDFGCHRPNTTSSVKTSAQSGKGHRPSPGPTGRRQPFPEPAPPVREEARVPPAAWVGPQGCWGHLLAG